jgi:hypothetical protein
MLLLALPACFDRGMLPKDLFMVTPVNGRSVWSDVQSAANIGGGEGNVQRCESPCAVSAPLSGADGPRARNRYRAYIDVAPSMRLYCVGALQDVCGNRPRFSRAVTSSPYFSRVSVTWSRGARLTCVSTGGELCSRTR